MAAPQTLKPVIIYEGKRGRNALEKPMNEILFVKYPIDKEPCQEKDTETNAKDTKENNKPIEKQDERKVAKPLDAATLESVTKKVRDILATHHGYRFDSAYMEAHGGSYGIPMIAIDIDYTVHASMMPLYRPTSSGGHVAFRTGQKIKDVLAMTQGDSILYVSKFKDYECVLVTPNALNDPKLYNALNLETLGDTIALMFLRVCDKFAVGKSQPKLAVGKFKFLFPGHIVDYSQVPKDKDETTKQKRKRGDETVDDLFQSPKTSEYTTKEELAEDLRNVIVKGRRAFLYKRTAEEYLARYHLSIFSSSFIEALMSFMPTDEFLKAFTPYVDLIPAVALNVLGDRDMARLIVRSHVHNQAWKESMLKYIDTFNYDDSEFYK